MLSEQTHADIQLKINEVRYLWNDNFRPDLDRFLDKLSAHKEPSADYSNSFGSVFFTPKKASSGYGFNKQTENAPRDDEQVLNSAPKLS